MPIINLAAHALVEWQIPRVKGQWFNPIPIELTAYQFLESSKITTQCKGKLCPHKQTLGVNLYNGNSLSDPHNAPSVIAQSVVKHFFLDIPIDGEIKIGNVMLMH